MCDPAHGGVSVKQEPLGKARIGQSHLAWHKAGSDTEFCQRLSKAATCSLLRSLPRLMFNRLGMNHLASTGGRPGRDALLRAKDHQLSR